jgi:adenylate kinase
MAQTRKSNEGTRCARRFQVIYLTGAPATGKSSLTRALKAEISPLYIFEFGAKLTAHVKKRQLGLQQAALRTKSSQIVNVDDVAAIDTLLLREAAAKRNKTHFIVDSHAVTKEVYGYRVTAFESSRIRELAPTLIVCLYAEAEVVKSRIAMDAAGRPQLSAFEADFHNTLQAAVAIEYAIQAACPVYFLDSAKPRCELVDFFRSKLQ